MSREYGPGQEPTQESTMDVHHTGIPGVNGVLVVEIDDREQAMISERLSTAKAVDRILEEIPEGEINKAELLSAMTHLDEHIREIDPATIVDHSILPGEVRPEVLFAIPPQNTTQLKDGLVAAGLEVESKENGLVIKFQEKNVVSFLYDSKEAEGEVEDTPEQDGESAAHDAGE